MRYRFDLYSTIIVLSFFSCTKSDYNEFVSSDGTIVSSSHLMSLDYNLKPQPQGGDCFGGLFFQFSSDNKVVRVYDLTKRSLVQECVIDDINRGFVPNCHCNSVCFGDYYYTETDEFPLLYVSTGYASGGYTGALVYRVLREGGEFNFSLVQTLKFPQYGTASWTEFIPASDYCYVCYTSDDMVFKFQIPSVSEGDVVLSYSDAIESFHFSPQVECISRSRNQDRFYFKKKIIYVSGVPSSGEPCLFVVLDLENEDYEFVFSLFDLGLKQEPESVFLWGDKICIAFIDEIVQLSFSPSLFS